MSICDTWLVYNSLYQLLLIWRELRMNYNIVKHIGTLSDGKITTELNVIEWNGRKAQYDLRCPAFRLFAISACKLLLSLKPMITANSFVDMAFSIHTGLNILPYLCRFLMLFLSLVFSLKSRETRGYEKY